MPPVFGGGPGGGFVPIIILFADDWFGAGRGGEKVCLFYSHHLIGLVVAVLVYLRLLLTLLTLVVAGKGDGFGFTFHHFDNSSFAVDFFVFFAFFFFFFVGSFMLTARFNLNHANAMIGAKPPNTLETMEMIRICVSLFTADLPCSFAINT